MAELAILNDVTRCMGCRGCQVSCKQWNELPAEKTQFFAGNGYQNPADLSFNTWSLLKFTEWGNNGRVNWAFHRRACMHCSDAACVEVCPTGAMHHSEEGFVVLNEDDCVGCRWCQGACPFDVPRFEQKASKCILCFDRVRSDLPPACVKACSAGALHFGPRDEMLARARNRVAERLGRTVYGDTQLGGLHVIYVLPDEPARFDLPETPRPGSAVGVIKLLKCLLPGGLLVSALLALSRLDTGSTSTTEGEAPKNTKALNTEAEDNVSESGAKGPARKS